MARQQTPGSYALYEMLWRLLAVISRVALWLADDLAIPPPPLIPSKLPNVPTPGMMPITELPNPNPIERGCDDARDPGYFPHTHHSLRQLGLARDRTLATRSLLCFSSGGD